MRANQDLTGHIPTRAEEPCMPVADSAAISVIGNSPILTSAMTQLLQNEQLAYAVRSLLPDGGGRISIVERKTKEPNIQLSCDGLELELPIKFRQTLLQELVVRFAIRNSVISSLTCLAENGSLPEGCNAKLTLLAELYSGKPISTDSELRAVISPIIKGASNYITELTGQTTKRLEKLHLARHFTSAESASKATTTVISAISQLRALTWLADPSTEQVPFNGRGEKGLDALVVGLARSWEQAFATNSAADLEKISELYSTLLSALTRAGYNKAPPVFLIPLNEAPSMKINLAALLRQGIITTPGTSVFTTRSFARAYIEELPTIIKTLAKMRDLEAEARAWTTNDEQPNQEILEEIVPKLYILAKDLSTIKDSTPNELPESIRFFVNALARLRIHGGKEGLSTFSLLTSNINSSEETRRMMENPEAFALLRIRDYLELLEFVAAWPLRSESQRHLSVEKMLPTLSDTTARTIWILTGNYITNLSLHLKHENKIDPSSLSFLEVDLRRFALAATECLQHSTNPLMLEVIRKLSSDGVVFVERAVTALRLGNYELPEQLEHMHALPRSFGDCMHEQELKGYVEKLRTHISTELQGYPALALTRLTDSFDSGDLEQFVDVANEALLVARVTDCPDEIRSTIIAQVDHTALMFINLVDEGYRNEIRAREAWDKQNSATYKPSLACIESLGAQLDLFTLVDSFLRKHSALLPPARLNHLNQIVVTTLGSHPETVAKMLENMHTNLRTGAPSDLVVQRAQLLLKIPNWTDQRTKGAEQWLSSLKNLLRP
ncbi:MAG: hypothetical protein WCN89_00445 [bacterium]